MQTPHVVHLHLIVCRPPGATRPPPPPCRTISRLHQNLLYLAKQIHAGSLGYHKFIPQIQTTNSNHKFTQAPWATRTPPPHYRSTKMGYCCKGPLLPQPVLLLPIAPTLPPCCPWSRCVCVCVWSRVRVFLCVCVCVRAYVCLLFCVMYIYLPCRM